MLPFDQLWKKFFFKVTFVGNKVIVNEKDAVPPTQSFYPVKLFNNLGAFFRADFMAEKCRYIAEIAAVRSAS